MKIYICKMCGHEQDTRNAVVAGDESLDCCEACGSYETMESKEESK